MNLEVVRSCSNSVWIHEFRRWAGVTRVGMRLTGRPVLADRNPLDTLRSFKDSTYAGRGQEAALDGSYYRTGVKKDFQAQAHRGCARARMPTTGYPTSYIDIALLTLHSAPEWNRGTLDQECCMGLRLVHDA